MFETKSMIRLPPFYTICNRTKRPYHSNVNKSTTTNVSGDKNLSTLNILKLLQALSSIPMTNDYGITRELSRGSELPNSFMDGNRWLGFRLYENILHGG